MSELLDPFNISRIVTTYFQITPKEGVMYCSNSFDEFISFDGTKDELKALVLKETKFRRDTDSLKVVTVYGFKNLENIKQKTRALQGWAESISYGGYDHYSDEHELEQECYSFLFDDRK